MRLEHAEQQEAPARLQVRREDLERITAVASRLQEERREQLSPDEVEAIGLELGIEPEFMREAMLHVAAPSSQVTATQAEVRAVPLRRSRRAVFAAIFGSLAAMPLALMLFSYSALQETPSTATLSPPVPVEQVVATPLPAPFSAIGLQSHANHPLTGPIHGKGTELNTLPQGATKLGGAYFRIDSGIIHLRGAHARELPSGVDGIRVGRKVQSLHFLQSTGYGAGIKLSAGTEIGEYVVHYADGATARVPITYGADVVDWWEHAGEPALTRGKVAWVGSIKETDEHRVRLFTSEWTNPHPGKQVTTVDFHSHGTECDPFLAAITAK